MSVWKVFDRLVMAVALLESIGKCTSKVCKAIVVYEFYSIFKGEGKAQSYKE